METLTILTNSLMNIYHMGLTVPFVVYIALTSSSFFIALKLCEMRNRVCSILKHTLSLVTIISLTKVFLMLISPYYFLDNELSSTIFYVSVVLVGINLVMKYFLENVINSVSSSKLNSKPSTTKCR